MDALQLRSAAHSLGAELQVARAHTDALFRLVAPQTLYERPIAERHRLIFYVGHFDAFDWNQLARDVLDMPSFHPGFDQLFEAGIDPLQGQGPRDRPSDWPQLDAVLRYVERTRNAIDEVLDELPPERLLTAIEHRWMHAETLCYLLHELPPYLKQRPPAARRDLAPVAQSVRSEWIDIPGGRAKLGQAPGAFGWDNEFPRHEVIVDGFRLARYKVTNGEYLRFVEAGGNPSHFWKRTSDGWTLRRMFDAVPLPLNDPVYLTYQQAVAYARWVGARLPTEAEWQRAAYGAGARTFPWGDAPPSATTCPDRLRRLGHGAGQHAPGWRNPGRRRADARQRMGVDRDALRRFRGLSVPPLLPRLLGGLLRRRPLRAERRFGAHGVPAGTALVPQLVSVRVPLPIRNDAPGGFIVTI